MGMEIKRSDTPEFVQEFLEKILFDALSGHKEADVIAYIKNFKKEFQSIEPWKKGMPKRVNNLTQYTKMVEKQQASDNNVRLQRLKNMVEESQDGTIPGHVRASINWNNLKRAHSDAYSTTIMDGAKVIVCRLKSNPMGYKSIAYPTDETTLPQWFKELPFDEEEMETAVLDKKIQNVLGQMGWDLDRTKESEAFDEFFA
jgi:hypothetical protein